MTALAKRSTLLRLAAAALVITGLGASLSACGNSGATLAKQACTHINRSITLLKESDHQSDHGRCGPVKQQAYDQLRAALPIAAEAAYNDGQWQALMTTVSESNRVPESTLVGALKAQCSEADSHRLRPGCRRRHRSLRPPPSPDLDGDPSGLPRLVTPADFSGGGLRHDPLVADGLATVGWCVVGVVKVVAGHLQAAHPDHIGQHPGVEPLAGRRGRHDVHAVTVPDLDPVERRGVVAARAQLGAEVVDLDRGRVLGSHLAHHVVVVGQPGGRVLGPGLPVVLFARVEARRRSSSP